MKLQQFISDDDAVSPVIGVILMVAITVILAAVIGAFVLGIGGNQNVAPQVTFDVEETDTQLTFTHTSGDTIDSANETLSVNGDDVDNSSVTNMPGDTMAVGDFINVDVSGIGSSANGGDVRVIWSAPGSSDTSALTTYTLSNQG
jgi:flagellin-like protein